MPRVKRKNFETFSDGILSICETKERTLVRTKMQGVRFGHRTIGERRYFDAQTAGNNLSRLVSVPTAVQSKERIESLDVVILDSQKSDTDPAQYKIVQIQEKLDTMPPVLYLSLEKIVQVYKDRRTDRE